MAVTQIPGSDYRIDYHSTNIISPRRVNVLIVGMSLCRSVFVRVDWIALSVAMEDVQRIEMTRGPNSASYGTNSMLPIINIITKHPKEAERNTWKTTGEARGTEKGMARYVGKIGERTN